MSWLSSILKVAAPATALIPGVGPIVPGLIGAAGGLADVVEGQQAISRAKKQQQQARDAEAKRFAEVIGLYKDRLNYAKTLNDQVSEQELADTNKTFDTLQSDTAAYLGARGLGNTTIAPTIFSGITADRSAALNRVRDNRLKRTVDLNSTLTGDLAAAIERPTIKGPSDADITALGTAAGQAQAALSKTIADLIAEMQKKKGEGPATINPQTVAARNPSLAALINTGMRTRFSSY